MTFQLPHGQTHEETLEVLHVPALGNNNLLSIKQLLKGGRRMIFNETSCDLRNRSGSLIAIGSLDNSGIHNLELVPSESRRLLQSLSMRAVDLSIAHQSIIHRNKADIRHMTNSTQGL